MERLRDFRFVEGPDHDAIESHLGGFQQHALCCNAQVDVHELRLRYRTADDDEGFGFRPRKWQMKLGQQSSQLHILEDGVGPSSLSDQLETQHLLVLR